MSRPNVIICQCDQLRTFAVGCYGNEIVRTPNIDRLAAGGVRFARAVTNNPVCTPARSCLLSGQYSRTCTGMLGNVHEEPPNERRVRLTDPTIAELFRDAGYRTALIGKWHVDPNPQLVGFDECLYPKIAHRNYGQEYYEDSSGPRKVDRFAPEFELEAVESLLDRADSPLFLHYNISPPHGPIGPGNAPDRYVNMYDPAEIPLRPNVDDREGVRSEPADWEAAGDERDRWWWKVYTIWDYFWRKYPVKMPDRESDRLADDFDLRTLTAYYYGMTTLVDDLLGRLMDALRTRGLAEDTLVVFLSDHGDNLGSHGLYNKGSLIEEAIRVPMIFHYPRGLSPRVASVRSPRRST